MNKIKLILLSLIVLLAISGTALADFSDNFNDNDISDWSLTGSWSTPTGSWDGTRYLSHAVAVGSIQYANHTTSGSGAFMHGSFDAKQDSKVVSEFTIAPLFDNNSAYIGILQNTGNLIVPIGFSGTSFSPTANIWYHYDFYINASMNVHYIISYSANGTILKDESGSINATITNLNLFYIKTQYGSGATMTIGVDNVFSHAGVAVYSVSGFVNETSGSPISGATISYSGGSTTTGTLGDYSFPVVNTGTYDFTASKTGFTSQIKSITVTSNLVNQNFTLINQSVTSNNISFSSNTYILGDTLNFTWTIKDSDWVWYKQFSWALTSIDLGGVTHYWKPDGTEAAGLWTTTLGTQTGGFDVKPPLSGLYDIGLYDGWISKDLISNDSAQIFPLADSSIIINSSVPYHTQIPVTYSFGFGGINLNNAIQTYYLNPSSNTYQFEHSFFGLSSSGTRNVYFEKVGTYIIKLRNVATDTTYAQTSTQTTFAAPETTINITTSSLNINKASYFYGDSLHGNYTIDSTNWTAGQIYLDVYNWDRAIVTSEMGGEAVAWTDVSLQQQGDLIGTFLNSPASANFPPISFQSGNNTLRLMLKNSTGTTTILASQNFTLTDLTSTGYGLRLSKYSVLTNEKFFAYATVPENAKLILVNTGLNISSGSLLANIGVNQSPATIPISISKEGNYAILLNNPSGNTEIMQNVVVSTAIVTPTSTIPPEQQISTSTSNITSLLSSNLFWALIFTVGMMAMVAFATSQKKEQ